MKRVVSGVCGLFLALCSITALGRSVARVEVVVPRDWGLTYCVVSNGQGASTSGWATGGGICVTGYFNYGGTYHVFVRHNGIGTENAPIAEVLDSNGNQIEPPGDSFYLPAPSFTVNVLLSN